MIELMSDSVPECSIFDGIEFCHNFPPFVETPWVFFNNPTPLQMVPRETGTLENDNVRGSF